MGPNEECHFLRGASQRSKACVPLAKKAPHALLLTGTPLVARTQADGPTIGELPRIGSWLQDAHGGLTAEFFRVYSWKWQYDESSNADQSGIVASKVKLSLRARGGTSLSPAW